MHFTRLNPVTDEIASTARAMTVGEAINVVTNAPADAADVVGALIDHEAVRRVNFTGSTAVGRIIVADAVADEFVRRFAIKARSMPAGDPREGTTPLGAVADRRTMRHVNGLIDDATARGATVVAGGKAGIDQSTELRWISPETQPGRYPI